MTSSSEVTARTRAIDGVLRTAGSQREFTVTDIINQSKWLDESQRRTVKRALREMEKLGRVAQRASGSRYWLSELLPTKREVKPDEELPEPEGDFSMLHVFADYGVEAEALSQYGNVLRVSINAHPNDASECARADATEMPIDPEKTFDLGVFHPPCGKWADLTSISGDSNDWPDLIPLSREIADRYCDHYIIENKPEAPLEDPTVLSGKMFGLPVKYERAFETSFPVSRVPVTQTQLDTECSPYFYSDRSKAWWAGVKGYSQSYPKQHLAKNCVPASFIHHLMRQFLNATNARDSDYARSTHSDETPRRILTND